MSSVQSNTLQRAKKESIAHVGRMQLVDTEEEMARIVDLKYNYMSAMISTVLKVFMGNLDDVVEKTRESLKNDLTAILGMTSSISELRNTKVSGTSKEYQQDLGSEKPGLVDRTEEDAKGKAIDEENRRFAREEEGGISEGKELFQNKSPYPKFKNSMDGVSPVKEESGNCDTRVEVTGQGREAGEKISIDEGILSLAADFSSATLDINRQWSDVFNILRENDFDPELQCQVRLAFKCDGEVKTFLDLQSLSKFISQKSLMRELLKDVLPQGEKVKQGGRRYGIQEKMGKALTESNYGAGGTTSDSLSFLFIKEVRVAEPEEKESSELGEEEEASELEEQEESLELEDGEMTSDTEEEEAKTQQIEEPKDADFRQKLEEALRMCVTGIVKHMQEKTENTKNHHSEVVEVKDSTDDPTNRINVFEERMNNLEGRIEGFSVDPLQMAKQIMKKERLRDREDKSRSTNIRLIGIPEKDNRENGAEDIIEEIIEENFPDLKKDPGLEIASACRIPSTFDENRLTPRHILVKFWNSKDKEKILKVSRAREGITYRGVKIRLTADLSLDTLDARSKWSSIIKVLQEKGFRPKILYPAKLAFNFEGRKRVFYDIEEFRDFIFYIPYLKRLLADVF